MNAMFDGRDDGRDTLGGILVRYEAGPTLAQISADLAAEGRLYYEEGRHSNWFLASFADLGVVAFVNNQLGTNTVEAVLLLSPSTLSNGVLNLRTEPTPVLPIVDLHAGEPNVMKFGTVDVTASVTGLTVSDDEVLRLKGELRLAMAGGAMIYQPHAAGSYAVAIRGHYTPKAGGSVTVHCTINGGCPYGPVSATGEETDTIVAATDVAGESCYSGVLSRAREKAERALADAMLAQGPPTADDARRAAWNRLFNELRQAGLANETVPAPVAMGVLF